jgi:phenol 2-monooxygenase
VQFYLDGFRPGDPDIAPASATASLGGELPDEVDVLIVGTGPAGLVLAAQLAAFPEITTRIVERRDGPLELGQADGVACRSVEMFDAFGISDRLLREGYWVNETVFWSPSGDDRSRIERSGRIQDVEDGLSEFPHLIVNQARIHSYLLDVMAKSPTRLVPDYGLEFTGLEIDEGSPDRKEQSHPVRVTLRDTTGAEKRVAARYVVGCDGARSAVRTSIGRVLEGDSANQAWGVIDVLAVTDFPDIRFKAAIQSEHGNMILIPREGGYLVRLYIELDELAPDERVAARSLGQERLIEVARRILNPYTLDVREVVWWSVYEIGQRITDKFDDVPTDETATRTPRVFIAGDACHTHSPKAGQGMNVSMQDGFNLGWKLASVLRGQSSPELLHSYSAERQEVAQRLIDFDRDWAKMFSEKPKDPTDPGAGGISPADFVRRFEAGGRYTAGVATTYPVSALVGGPQHAGLAAGFPLGERFHSAPVVRLADGKRMQLGHVAQADGRWRLYVFADRIDPREPGSRFRAFGDQLTAPGSVLERFGGAGDPDAAFDVRGIVQQTHREIEIRDLPEIFRPHKGALGLSDYEKAFCPDLKSGDDIFELRGIDRDAGCLVVVRPDQYVGHVLPLDAIDELADYLAGHLLEAGDRAGSMR